MGLHDDECGREAFAVFVHRRIRPLKPTFREKAGLFCSGMPGHWRLWELPVAWVDSERLRKGKNKKDGWLEYDERD